MRGGDRAGVEGDETNDVVIAVRYEDHDGMGIVVVSVGINSMIPADFMSAPTIGLIDDARRARIAAAVVSLVTQCLSDDGEIVSSTTLAGPGMAQA